MKVFSESYNMSLDIIDIFKKDNKIYLTLSYLNQSFNLSSQELDKSIRVGDWKVIDSD